MPHQNPFVLGQTADKTLAGMPSLLGIDSTLQELPLHQAQLDLNAPGTEAAKLFNTAPQLPGIFLLDQDEVVGVISRYRFLEYLLRPKGCELFLKEPLSVLYSYARSQPLVLDEKTTILVAARAALRRSIELQGEPLQVKGQDGDRLLSPHDLNVAYWQIRGIETQVRYERIQAEMLQSQKMAALGRLVDGVAHEILDPLGFIWGNLRHVSRYCNQLLALVKAYEQTLPPSSSTSEIEEIREDIELDYLQQDLPETLSSIQNGAERLRQLATSLQNFCYVDEVYPKPADIHDLLESIVLLLKSRLTTQIQIIRQYHSLPPIPCFAGQLSQVFMNILAHCVNTLLTQGTWNHAAADLPSAICQAVETQPNRTPQILIATELLSVGETGNPSAERWISITIADNGPGLSAAAQQHILNSFSVERRLERETDLAVSYRIITAKHGGKFWVRSPAAAFDNPNNQGTEFIIQMPIYNHSHPK